MAVSEIGTPAAVAIQSASNTGSVTGTWGTGQNRTAGNALVASVTAFGSTTAGTISTPAGWVREYEVVTTDGRNRVAQYTMIAAGADAAPNFTATMTGTATLSRMSCYLQEFSGTHQTTPSAANGSNGAATTSPVTITSAGNVPAAGCLAVSAWNIVTSTAVTLTFTQGAAWTNKFSTGATSARSHSAVDIIAGPASGATLSEQITSTGTLTDVAGGLIVLQPPAPAAAARPGIMASPAYAVQRAANW